MIGTLGQSEEREERLDQVEKIVDSQVLRGSESLCKLLRYLADHVLDHPGSSLEEYQIATEVFGRPSDFDPQHDATIRVQAGRLRLKLAEYYSSEGAADSLIVEVPKGTYILTFDSRERTSQGPPDPIHQGFGARISHATKERAPEVRCIPRRDSAAWFFKGKRAT